MNFRSLFAVAFLFCCMKGMAQDADGFIRDREMVMGSTCIDEAPVRISGYEYFPHGRLLDWRVAIPQDFSGTIDKTDSKGNHVVLKTVVPNEKYKVRVTNGDSLKFDGFYESKELVLDTMYHKLSEAIRGENAIPFAYVDSAPIKMLDAPTRQRN